MLALLDAEHLELVLIPAAHDVQAEAALADVIGRDHLLRGDDRMEQRRMHGAEHGDAPVEASRPEPRSPSRASRPGSRFAAVALPAADRQQEVDPGLVRHPREPQLSAQLPDQRSGTLVTARPDEQFAPNSPIFSALPPCHQPELAATTRLQFARLSLRLESALTGRQAGWQR